MTFVVTENCIKCKYTDCVEVCPVDCFHEGPNFLVIDPDEWFLRLSSDSMHAALADAVAQRGGEAIAVACDQRDEAQVAALFERVASERGRLDVLVNSAWGGYESMVEDGCPGVNFA